MHLFRASGSLDASGAAVRGRGCGVEGWGQPAMATESSADLIGR